MNAETPRPQNPYTPKPITSQPSLITEDQKAPVEDNKAPMECRLVPDVAHQEQIYVFRYVDGLEMALGGITGWSSDDGHYIFFDEKGPTLIVPKERMACFMVKPEDKNLQEKRDDSSSGLEERVNAANLPVEAKEKLLQIGEKQADRFLVRQHHESQKLFLFDVEGQVKDLQVEDTIANRSILNALAGFASEGDRAQKSKASTDKAEREAVVTVRVYDQDAEPTIRMRKDVFNESIQRKEIALIHVPVVERLSAELGEGQRYRICDEGETIAMHRCEMVIDSKLKLGRITMGTPVGASKEAK